MDYDASKIIESLGGTAKVARLFGIKSASVSEWKANGEIPKARLQFILAVYPGVFRGQRVDVSKKARQLSKVA